ncbi:hypothetical protein [Methylobacterium oryzisoli]|uniref:hypothetical protein n=1 Tax=Methylobacterium oryzisoli TaxID=3385502 RepID=UPI003891F3AF
MAGTPVLIGNSSAGGNSCEAVPFVISLPVGKAPSFDGPINTCWVVNYTVGADRISFSTPAAPNAEGERWVWTPADGLRSDGRVAFAPASDKGWADLRDRSLEHPMELFDNGAVSVRLAQLLGDQKPQALTAMSGPGGGRYEGDRFIGEVCQWHNCPSSGGITVVDIPGKRVFIAWKPDGKKIEVRPPVGEWPSEVRRPLATWAQTFEPKR